MGEEGEEHIVSVAFMRAKELQVRPEGLTDDDFVEVRVENSTPTAVKIEVVESPALKIGALLLKGMKKDYASQSI